MIVCGGSREQGGLWNNSSNNQEGVRGAYGVFLVDPRGQRKSVARPAAAGSPDVSGRRLSPGGQKLCVPTQKRNGNYERGALP